MDSWSKSSTDPGTVRETVRRFGVSPLTARLLEARGLAEEEIPQYLASEGADLPDPDRIPGMVEAVERLGRAIRGGERILVHGDYDVDGLMGSAILTAGLRACGGSVEPFLPSRFGGGYGLGERGIQAALDANASVLLTTDCGTNSRQMEAELRSKGVDLVVTDHHLPLEDACRDCLVVNPHLVEDHPDRNFCAATVAMQFVRALGRALDAPIPMEPFLRLAAIATIADMVPLSPVNRAICKVGLKTLTDSPSPALQALFHNAGVHPPLRSYHVSFILAPRFNSAGRMEDPRLVLDLLLERDPAKAAALANRLEELNRQRKQTQATVLEDARIQADEAEGTRVVFVASDDWHKGVLGPVAARLAEVKGRSAFVAAIEGDSGIGSARAWGSDNVTELLARGAEHLTRYGGHASAAGFTVPRESIDGLRSALQSAPPPDDDGNGAMPYIPVEPDEVEGIWESWGIMDPFGPGNPEPYLGLAGLNPFKARVVKDKYLIWEARLPSGKSLTLTSWDGLAKGLSPRSGNGSRLFIGRPVMERYRRDLPFYFNVATVL